MFCFPVTFFFKCCNHFLRDHIGVFLTEFSKLLGTPMNFIRVAIDLNPVVATVSCCQQLVHVLLSIPFRVSAVAASLLDAPLIIRLAAKLFCAFHLLLDPSTGLIIRLGLLFHRCRAVIVDPFPAPFMEYILGVSACFALLQ